MSFSVSWVSPHGDWVDLSPDKKQDGPVLVPGGITGLVGGAEASSLTAPGRSGQVVDGFTVPPMEGDLSFVLYSPSGRMPEVWSRFRSLWPVGPRAEYGTLIIEKDGRQFSARCRATAVPAAPVENIRRQRIITDVTVSLICDDGFWLSEPNVVEGPGSVTVTNLGDVTTYPQIRWGGGISGLAVTLPGGPTLALPNHPYASDLWLLLDNHESLAVVDQDGTLDRLNWPIAGARAVPVPPGESRTVELSGDRLFAEWSDRVFDPWKG